MSKPRSITFELLANEYLAIRRNHWDDVAQRWQKRRGWGGYYHRRLGEAFRFFIPAGSRILDIGCGNGDLLASLSPSLGVGIDFSSKTIQLAQASHPELHLITADCHQLPLRERFDFIILSDLLNDTYDVQMILDEVRRLSFPYTRILINCYSRVWQAPLWIAEKVGLAKPNLPQNWLTPDDIHELCRLSGMEVIRNWMEALLPINIPLVSPIVNKVLIRIWPFTLLGLTNCYLIRPAPSITTPKSMTTSIIIPARNEAGNIPEIFHRLHPFGKAIELIFVEGHSTDQTYETILREIKKHPGIKSLVIRQPGAGKADAVRAGFDLADGELLMILDADLSTPPEYLERFYTALLKREGELINGVRLVYPLPRESMQFLNFLGNKFFSMAFTWLLGQPVKDTLCGTKALLHVDYKRIAANRIYFGNFDPFGDFDLLFGATKLGLKIIDIPVRYQERTYGKTNINRYKHGALLLRMMFYAARRLKFV